MPCKSHHNAVGWLDVLLEDCALDIGERLSAWHDLICLANHWVGESAIQAELWHVGEPPPATSEAACPERSFFIRSTESLVLDQLFTLRRCTGEECGP